jgi:hypothetical protein
MAAKGTSSRRLPIEIKSALKHLISEAPRYACSGSVVELLPLSDQLYLRHFVANIQPVHHLHALHNLRENGVAAV